MFNRRNLLAAAGAGVLAPTVLAPAVIAQTPDRFVRRVGPRLMRDGQPYRFVGANAWYLAWLGADADYGDRARLTRELDRLAADGATNIRLAASAEDSPLRNSVKPAFRDRTGCYNETLLVGLDWTLARMAERDQTAVLYLTNFWEWSGGLMTYLSWVNGGDYIDMNDPAHPWPAFPDMIAAVYANAEARALYHDYVRAVVGRTNTVTGVAYRDDPTIMAWQLANEPRPGGSEAVGRAALPAYLDWIATTAGVIKSVDPNHLVSVGVEGLKGALEDPDIVRAVHRQPGVDYMTAHIWPGNWGWLDRRDMAGTHDAALDLVQDYVDRHIGFAAELDIPLVIEEFGYPRDGDRYDPDLSVTMRDDMYRRVFEAVERGAAAGPLVGSNFWTWNGEERAAHEDFQFRDGDAAWLGDPPHEPQGWYGVFDTDETTRALVRAHAAALAALPASG